jgi:hypothetical protein
MLYYEGIFIDSYGPSQYGWVIDKVQDSLYLDGNEISMKELLEFIELKMKISGLEDNEVEFLINRIVENDMLEFEVDHLLIKYIPEVSVDEAIELDIPDGFTLMRRHFLLEASNDNIELMEPSFNTIKSPFMIHETAVNRISDLKEQ